MIDLKKYSVNDLTDFDLRYVRVDNMSTLTFHYDVFFNNKKLGEIHARERKMMGVAYEFKTIDSQTYLPIRTIHDYERINSIEDMQKAIELQILGIAKFIMKFYEND